MGAMRIVEAKHATIVFLEQMRQQEGKIVANDFIRVIDPYLFAKDADSSRATKPRLVIGDLTKQGSTTHKNRLAQMMLDVHHLC